MRANAGYRRVLRRAVCVALLLSLLASAALAEAAGGETPSSTLPPCVSRGDDPLHEHIYGDLWVSYTRHTHSAHCEYPGCTRWERVLCEEINVETGSGEVLICPVCGAVTRGDELLAEAGLLSGATLTDSAQPGEWHGEPLARLVQLDENTVIVTVCYACHGACQPHSMDVRLAFSEEDSRLLEGFSLMALGGAQDMNLSFGWEEGQAVLTMRCARRPAAVFLFTK